MLLNSRYLILIFMIAQLMHVEMANANISNAWPNIKTLNESDCLILEDHKILVESGAYTKEFSVNAKFLLVNADGEIYTNAKIKKSFDTLTFSIKKTKKATHREQSQFKDCYKRMDLEVGAYSEKYRKLYIVVDNVVLYEFNL